MIPVKTDQGYETYVGNGENKLALRFGEVHFKTRLLKILKSVLALRAHSTPKCSAKLTQ